MSEERAPGLGAQFGRTRAAFVALFQSHIDLLKAEIGEIANQIKLISAQAGCAIAIAIFTGTLLYVGGFLFLGEWLFGSIGWGLAHGVLFGLAMIAILGLAIVGASRGPAIGSLLVATLLTIGVAWLCGSNVAYNTANNAAGQLAFPFNGTAAVALVGGAVIGAILFALMLARVAGRGGFIGGLFLGVVIGAIVGWLIAAAPWTWPPAVGFAITIGLIAWPILDAVMALPGIDPAARFAKLYPRESLETAKESRAWLEEQWQTRRAKLGGR
ncbi:MAG TPA: hypothetical protein VM284_02690 [Candidatus Limnocylindria bacterium]|nr:hypothetical protein [Candidatus Limnocylindria bacterium]